MEKPDYDLFVAGSSKTAEPAIKEFVKKFSQKFNLAELTQSGQWKPLWCATFKYLKDDAQPASIYNDCLSTIRILSRDKTYLNDVLCDDQIECLLNLAEIGPNKPKTTTDVAVSIESLKCLCNLVFNSTVCQEMCNRNSAVEGIVKRIRTYKDHDVKYEIQFFDMKLLFLITALNPNIREKVRDDLHGLTYLVEMLDMTLHEIKESPWFDDRDIDLMCEILKVLFNLTARNDSVALSPSYDEEELQFRRLAGVLHDLILNVNSRNREKQQELLSNSINLLTSIPTSCYSELVPLATSGLGDSKAIIFEGYTVNVLDVMLDYLKHRLELTPKLAAQNELLGPVLTALIKSCRCNSVMRRYIRTVVLPPLKDVKRRPEEGTELRNYLCRLLTSPGLQVRDLVAELLFVICKENVGRMVKHTGYGNAAGMFANRGLLGGRTADASQEYSSDSEDSDTEEYKQLQHAINPVVGCYEAPKPNPFEGMTEEQKEYEAMKLVELIDKLDRQGIMKPARIGLDGRPEPVEHILQLQEEIPQQQSDFLKHKT